jgi:hypothetical protein
VAELSLAERIEIDLAEPREDHCILKLACRRIAGAGKGYSAGMFERERTRPAFGYDWTQDLTSFTRCLQSLRHSAPILSSQA